MGLFGTVDEAFLLQNKLHLHHEPEYFIVREKDKRPDPFLGLTLPHGLGSRNILCRFEEEEERKDKARASAGFAVAAANRDNHQQAHRS